MPVTGGAMQADESTADESTADPTGAGAVMQIDNWVHRSEGMTCATCMYYCPKRRRNIEGRNVGRCRRRAPTMSGWPVMYPTDWCGDHKLDETK